MDIVGDLVTPPAIIDSAEAGEAAKARKHVQNLVKGMNTSTFDLMDGLWVVKSKKFYLPKYDSYPEFAETLDISVRKAYYLVRIKEVMVLAGIDRTVYEPVGIAKLRIIASIDVLDSEKKVNPEAIAKIQSMMELAAAASPEMIQEEVDIFTGNIGEEAFEWMNIKIKKSAKAVVKQAFDLVRMVIGTVGTDNDGKAKDASDGAVLEKISLDVLADPNYAPALAQLGEPDATNLDIQESNNGSSDVGEPSTPAIA
jgi:hypothetical protein